jgi:hypothetical protein
LSASAAMSVCAMPVGHAVTATNLIDVSSRDQRPSSEPLHRNRASRLLERRGVEERSDT